jgi:hypothetical protein
VPHVPEVPTALDVVWQQRITLPNNIVDPITGNTSVNFFNKVLTNQFV